MSNKLYAVNQKLFGQVLVAEFSSQQERELEVDNDFVQFRIEKELPVTVAHYPRDFTRFPLQLEQVKYFTTQFLVDDYEMAGGQFQRIFKIGSGRVDELLQIVERMESRRLKPPTLRQVAEETVWKKGPVGLEITIFGEHQPAELKYVSDGCDLLKLGVYNSSVSGKDFSRFIVSDATGNYQIPTEELIESKLSAAMKKAMAINYQVRNFYEHPRIDGAFESNELTAAINFARRMNVDVSKRVESIKNEHDVCWRKEVAGQLPQIVEDLYTKVSEYLCEIDGRDYYCRNEISRVLDFALSCDLAGNPALKNRVAQLAILRAKARQEDILRQKRVVGREIANYTHQLHDSEKRAVEIEARRPKVFSDSNKQADDLLSRLGLDRKKRHLLRKKTKPLKIKTPDDYDYDDVPF